MHNSQLALPTSQQGFLSDLLGGLGAEQAAQQRQQQVMPPWIIDTNTSDQERCLLHHRPVQPVLSFINKLRNEIDEWLKL